MKTFSTTRYGSVAATRGKTVARDEELMNGTSATDDDPNQLTYLEEDGDCSGSCGAGRCRISCLRDTEDVRGNEG